jgi:Protein of unknown function (DUF551)
MIDRFKKAGLMGCFDGSGVTSENYKEILYGPEWISVKDRLPEEGTLVLIHRTGEPLSVDYTVDIPSEGPIWACLLQDEMYKVTHWMPLPEPPND